MPSHIACPLVSERFTFTVLLWCEKGGSGRWSMLVFLWHAKEAYASLCRISFVKCTFMIKNTFKKFSVASRIQKSMKMIWYICQPFTAQSYISCYFVYITPSENTMVLNIPYHMSFPPLSGQTSSLVAWHCTFTLQVWNIKQISDTMGAQRG